MEQISEKCFYISKLINPTTTFKYFLQYFHISNQIKNELIDIFNFSFKAWKKLLFKKLLKDVPALLCFQYICYCWKRWKKFDLFLIKLIVNSTHIQSDK